jgi:hypothetical protein
MKRILLMALVIAGFHKPIATYEPPYRPMVLSEQISASFGTLAPTMTAVLKAESNLNPNAMNWNCRYGKRRMACRPEDRAKAVSVDCGIAQINHPGRQCPKELFDVETNLTEAKKRLDTQGLRAWSVYNNHSYEKYLQG